MSLFDALHISNQAMHVHRFRSEIAAENLSHVYADPNYRRKVVDIDSTSFSDQLGAAQRAQVAGMPFGMGLEGSRQATEGVAESVISVAGVSRQEPLGSERGTAMLDTVEMMRSKNAYELSGRVASMVRSMAISALEIGRGG